MLSSRTLDYDGSVAVGAPIPRAGAIVAVLQIVITMAVLVMCLSKPADTISLH